MVIINTILLLSLIFTMPFSNVCTSGGLHALILARGGSKGIRHKNLLKINGISILAHTIITVQNSTYFNSIWVSTDSNEIAAEAMKYGALVHKRPTLFAQDQTSSLDSVKEFLYVHTTVSRFALFQCTSIFLKTHYIVEAIEKFKLADCVFSVKRNYNLRWREVNNDIIPVNFDPTNRPRRQDWSGELIETGMFYFSTRELISRNRFQNERCAVVEIKSIDSLELDTLDDVNLFRCLTETN